MNCDAHIDFVIVVCKLIMDTIITMARDAWVGAHVKCSYPGGLVDNKIPMHIDITERPISRPSSAAVYCKYDLLVTRYSCGKSCAVDHVGSSTLGQRKRNIGDMKTCVG